MVQITHNLNGPRVTCMSHACANAKNTHGIRPRVYMRVKFNTRVQNKMQHTCIVAICHETILLTTSGA